MRKLKSLELFKLIESSLPPNDEYRSNLSTLFDKRFKSALRLYRALLEQIQDECRKHDAGLVLVLMAGRSLIERPGSNSAQFQEYLREKLLEYRRLLDIEVLDLASYLKSVHSAKNVRLFHPHEGHLTAAGHQMAAEFLHTRLKPPAPHKP
jgi:hypothetical protein